jgi:AbrB family looped-hinge helix DNA binding protein
VTVKVSPKYQVVIPEKIRQALNIRPGSRVEVIAKGHVAYLVPVPEMAELQERLNNRLDQKNIRQKQDRKL